MSRKFAVGNCETQHPIHQGGGFATFFPIEPVDVHYFPQMNSLGFSFSAQFADGSIRMYREDGLCPDSLVHSLKLKPLVRPWKDLSELPVEACYFRRKKDNFIFALRSAGTTLAIGGELTLNWGDALLKYEYGPFPAGTDWNECTVTE